MKQATRKEQACGKLRLKSPGAFGLLQLQEEGRSPIAMLGAALGNVAGCVPPQRQRRRLTATNSVPCHNKDISLQLA